MNLSLYLPVWIMTASRAVWMPSADNVRNIPGSIRELPISYAAGYALSTEFPGSSMRDLFRHADQNMYIDKNRAKMQETAERQKQDLRILHYIKSEGFTFSSCLYCDALQDQYRALRNSAWSFLAADGSYSGALEQIIQKLSTKETRKMFRNSCNMTHLISD